VRSESGIKQLNPVAPISDTLTNWGNGSHETKTRAPSATESPMLGLAVIIKESPSMKKTVSWYSTTRGRSSMAKWVRYIREACYSCRKYYNCFLPGIRIEKSRDNPSWEPHCLEPITESDEQIEEWLP